MEVGGGGSQRLYETGTSYGTCSYAVDVKSNKEGLTVGYTVPTDIRTSPLPEIRWVPIR